MTDRSRRFTEAQRRAFEWLTGEWKVEPGRAYSAAIEALHYAHGSLIDREVDCFDKRAQPDPSAALRIRYRLTAAGIAARATLNPVSEA